jgi:hypothetical protein
MLKNMMVMMMMMVVVAIVVTVVVMVVMVVVMTPRISWLHEICYALLRNPKDTNAFLQDIQDKLASIGNPMAIDQSTWKWIAITAAIVTGIVFIITLLMISRIRVAVACIKVWGVERTREKKSIPFYISF